MSFIERLRELRLAQSQDDKKYIFRLAVLCVIILLAIIIILCLTGDSFEIYIYIKKG